MVRQQVLILPIEGSNPSSPTKTGPGRGLIWLGRKDSNRQWCAGRARRTRPARPPVSRREMPVRSQCRGPEGNPSSPTKTGPGRGLIWLGRKDSNRQWCAGRARRTRPARPPVSRREMPVRSQCRGPEGNPSSPTKTGPGRGLIWLGRKDSNRQWCAGRARRTRPARPPVSRREMPVRSQCRGPEGNLHAQPRPALCSREGSSIADPNGIAHSEGIHDLSLEIRGKDRAKRRCAVRARTIAFGPLPKKAQSGHNLGPNRQRFHWWLPVSIQQIHRSEFHVC